MSSLDISQLGIGAKIGRIWFQWRSFSPVPLLLLMVVLPPDFTPVGWYLFLFSLGILLSEGLRLWAVGFAGSRTRTRNDEVKELVTAGPYRYVRNPLYIANIGLYTFCGLLFGFVGVSIVVFFYSCLEYVFIVSYEEEILKKQFGAAYTDFQSKVPRWLPNFSGDIKLSSHLFCMKEALRSEKSTLMAIASVAIVFFAKKLFF